MKAVNTLAKGSAARSSPPAALHPHPFEPLSRWYQSSGLLPPQLQVIDGAEMPEPYRTLLVHERDMTSTLEGFHGDQIILRVLGSRQDGGRYQREVVLLLEKTATPVEFGATHVRLDTLPAAARSLVIEARRPFGAILRDLAIPYRSRPKAYFRVPSDATMGAALGFAGHPVLYGRCNTISAPDGTAIADIVEILPPARAGV